MQHRIFQEQGKRVKSGEKGVNYKETIRQRASATKAVDVDWGGGKKRNEKILLNNNDSTRVLLTSFFAAHTRCSHCAFLLCFYVVLLRGDSAMTVAELFVLFISYSPIVAAELLCICCVFLCLKSGAVMIINCLSSYLILLLSFLAEICAQFLWYFSKAFGKPTVRL